MDYEQDSNIPSSQEPQPAGSISALNVGPPTNKPARKGSGWRIFWGIVLAFSVMANGALFLMLIGVIALFTTGQRGMFAEEVIR